MAQLQLETDQQNGRMARAPAAALRVPPEDEPSSDQDDAPPPAPARLLRLNAAANRALVAAYKVIGFLVLTTILVGITAFVGLHTFYLVHRAWVIPKILSPSDPDVLVVRARLAEVVAQRASLEGERAELGARLERLQLVAEAEQSFRDGLPLAVVSGAAQRRQSLEALEAARNEQNAVVAELGRIAPGLQKSSRDELERDFDARLITEQQLLEGTYRLAQLAQSRSSLMEQQVELNERIHRLERELGALELAVPGGGQADALATPSYEGLLLQREHARSRAEGQGAVIEGDALNRALADLGRAIAQYDELIAMLRTDPLLQAGPAPLALAFTAYDAEGAVAEGAPLYGCHLVLAFCERVGRVGAHVPGERTAEHPVYGKTLRGQWVQVVLDDAEWAKAKVLHANRPPLLF